MTATAKPEIGSTVVANGIETNYLEDGSGDDTVVSDPRFGSGSHVVRELAPGDTRPCHQVPCRRAGHGRLRLLGAADRCEVQRADVGGSNRRGDGRTGHREGQPGREQLRRRDRPSDRHPASRADRQAGPDGQHGGAVPDHRGPRTGVGVRGLLREHAQGARRVRLFTRAGERRARPGALRRQHSAGVPGSVLVDVSRSAAALGRSDVHARRKTFGSCRTEH